MSSPFQLKFMAKNPVKGFTMTMKELESSTKKAEEDMRKNADILNKRNPEANGPNYESTDPQRWAGDDGYDDSVEETDSPLYAYVSTAGHFQRLQDNIAAAFTPRGGKVDKEAEFKGETKKVSKKLKETTGKEFKGFKDGEYQIPSISGFEKNQTGSNYFSKYGQ
jgi:hypothetical protein